MNKEEFNALSFENQLTYINEQLSVGKSVSQISEALGYSKRAIGKKFNHKGYFLNDKKDRYILREGVMGDIQGDSSSSYISMLVESNSVNSALGGYKGDSDQDNNLPLQEAFEEDSMHGLNLGLEVNRHSNKEDITLLLQEKAAVLKELIEWFETQKKSNLIIKNSLIVDTDIPKDDIIKKSVRVSERVWNEFNEFCEKHQDFAKQDILNLALIRFLNANK